MVADSFGMEKALSLLWYLPVIALVLAFFLPEAISGSHSGGSGESETHPAGRP